MTWQTVKLGELARVRTGKLDANAADENGLYPFFTCAVEPLSINTPAFDCKAILVAGNGDLNVKYYEGKFNAYQRTYVIESLDEKILLPRYLYLFLNEYVNELRALAIGGVIKYIKLANLTDALIPLPPLAEQQRIAAILDEAELVKRKRELMIKKAMDLKQSIFLEMFGDLVKNNKNWNFVSIADFIKGFEGGKSFAAEADENAISKYRILKISSVTSLKFIHSQSKPVPILYVPPQNHFVKKGDLLFSRANTTELVGATAYVKETPANLLLPDKLWRFVWHEPPKALPLYVCSLFQSPQFRSLIGGLASGSSGSMKNISQAKVFSIKVGHPPLQLQYKFTKIVEAIDANLVLQDISSKKINDMNLAIQSKLLSASLYL